MQSPHRAATDSFSFSSVASRRQVDFSGNYGIPRPTVQAAAGQIIAAASLGFDSCGTSRPAAFAFALHAAAGSHDESPLRPLSGCLALLLSRDFSASTTAEPPRTTSGFRRCKPPAGRVSHRATPPRFDEPSSSSTILRRVARLLKLPRPCVTFTVARLAPPPCPYESSVTSSWPWTKEDEVVSSELKLSGGYLQAPFGNNCFEIIRDAMAH